ncbi:MAG: hypothetical protein ACREE4_01400 [Stellaceae bacterium]
MSHFEDFDVELLPGFAAPPAEPAYAAPFLSTGQCSWLGGTPEWKGDIPHPVPRRLLFVYVRGETEITAGDGAVRRFGAGSVLLAEDTWGTGHASRVIGGGDCIGLVFALPEGAG